MTTTQAQMNAALRSIGDGLEKILKDTVYKKSNPSAILSLDVHYDQVSCDVTLSASSTYFDVSKVGYKIYYSESSDDKAREVIVDGPWNQHGELNIEVLVHDSAYVDYAELMTQIKQVDLSVQHYLRETQHGVMSSSGGSEGRYMIPLRLPIA